MFECVVVRQNPTPGIRSEEKLKINIRCSQSPMTELDGGLILWSQVCPDCGFLGRLRYTCLSSCPQLQIPIFRLPEQAKKLKVLVVKDARKLDM